MSSNLTAYKTIFIRPEENVRVYGINNQNAFALTFTPLCNTGDTLVTIESVYFLISINHSSVIKYKLGIFNADSTSLEPSLTDLEDINATSSLAYSEINVGPTSSRKYAWVKFQLNTVLSLDTSDYYSFVITSDLEKASPQNGVLYTNTQGNLYNLDYLKKSFIFDSTDSVWNVKQENNIDVFPNIFMYGSELDTTNGINVGTTSTAGTSISRGYEVFLTLKNEGVSSVRNAIVYVVPDDTVVPSNVQTYAEETYLSPCKWLRFESNVLPLTYSDFNSAKDASVTAIKEIKVGDFVLLTQKDRLYPFPKTYIYTNTVLASLATVESDKKCYQYDPNSINIFNDDDSNLFIGSIDNNYKEFKLYNKSLFKDSTGIALTPSSDSLIINKYIKNNDDDLSNTGYKIISHDSTSELTISAKSIYPTTDQESLYFDHASLNQSIISGSDYSSVYTKYFDKLRVTPTTNGRFFDTKNEQSIDGEFQFTRLFAKNINNSSSDIVNGTAQLSNAASSDQIPYYVVDNYRSSTTNRGDYCESIGFCLFTGKTDKIFYSAMVPEYHSIEALGRKGLIDDNQYFSSSYTASQGLILVQHNITQNNNKNFIDAFVIKKISNLGIETAGRLISSTYFTKVEDLNDFDKEVLNISVNPRINLNNVFKWESLSNSFNTMSDGASGIAPFYGGILCSEKYDGDIYFGGSFTTVGGGVTSASYVAKWNGSSWEALGVGTDSGVHALAVYDDELYVGGFFSLAGGGKLTGIAKWDGAAWSAPNNDIKNTMGGYSPNVTALLTIDSGGLEGLYAGGGFTLASSSPANHVAKWNGSVWAALGDGLTGTASNTGVFALATDSTYLYAGGIFTTSGSLTVNNIAKWNGTSWAALSTGLNGMVRSILVTEPGVLYVTGDFTIAGSVSASYIAKWNGSSWEALGSGLNAAGRVLKYFNGSVYVGGDFTVAGGLTVGRIAKWDGTSWSRSEFQITNSYGDLQSIYTLYQDSTSLYVGGIFSAIVEGENIETTVFKVYFPDYSFNFGEGTDAQVNNLWLLPNPYYNTMLSNSSPSDSMFKIYNYVDNYLYLQGEIDSFKTVSGLSYFDASQSVPCYLVCHLTSNARLYSYDTEIENVAYGAGYAYGSGKFGSPITTDFFYLTDPLNTSDPYSGAFFGDIVSRVNVEDIYNNTGIIDRDLADTWYGYSSPSGIDGYSDYTSGAIVFVFDCNTLATNSDKTFYNKYNLQQLYSFIDRVNANVGIGFYTKINGTEYVVSASETNRETLKLELVSLWNAVTTSTSSYTYVELLNNSITGSCSLETVSGPKTIFFFGCNNTVYCSNVGLSTLTSNINGNNVVLNSFRIAPSYSSSFLYDLTQLSTNDDYKGEYTTYSNRSNLHQRMTRMISGDSASYQIPFLLPNIENYSIVVPFTFNSHQESLQNFLNKNTSISATTQTIEDGTSSSYEIFDTPINEWGDINTSYTVCESFFSPINYDNISYNASTDNTIFSFTNQGVAGGSSKSNSWVVELIKDENGAYRAANDINRITFAYKIGSSTSTDTESTSVRLLIQTSNSSGFDVDNETTNTLFDGIIDTNPNNIKTSYGTNSFIKYGALVLPDDFNLFFLDLDNKLVHDTTSSGIYSHIRYMRIYMEPSSNNQGESTAEHVIVKNLNVFNSDKNTFGYAPIFGTTTSPKNATNVTGTQYEKNNSYIVVDLGYERNIRQITLKTSGYSGDNDKLIIDYKTFINQSSSVFNNLTELYLSEESVAGVMDKTLNTSVFARFLIIKNSGFGEFVLKSLSIKVGQNSDFYLSSTSLGINYSAAYYNENISTSTNSNVCMLSNSRPYIGIKLSGDATAIPVTQVSFSALVEKNTIFQLQKTDDDVSAGTYSPTDSSWTTIKTFKVVNYERLPITSIQTNGINVDGITIVDKTLPVSNFYNNGVAGYAMRFVDNNDLVFMVLSSWSDGTNNYFTINADAKENGISVGSQYFLEKPNIITFASTDATALQLKQISGGKTKINNLKAYSSLLDSDGIPVEPSAATVDSLVWQMQIESI